VGGPVLDGTPVTGVLEAAGLDLPTWQLVAVLLAALIGGSVQSALGFGAAFTTVPALALFAPRLLPGSILVAILPLSITMVLRQRLAVDRWAVGRITVGRLPGIALGAAVVALLDVRSLTALIGGLLLAAVLASAAGWQVTVTSRREVAAGVVSGFTGTAAGLGGPPLALLYRASGSEKLRPTLAGVWLVGSLPALGALALAGSLTVEQVVAGGVLALAMVTGLTLAAPAVARVGDHHLRHLVLGWAGLGSVAALGRALLQG
jgi:uncharacterized protein